MDKTPQRLLTCELILVLALALACCIGLKVVSDQPAPCASEDVSGITQPCHWDAATQGNGLGRSFTAYPDGRVEYDEP